MKRCPNCGRQYPDDANFCPADAGRLEADLGSTQRGHPAVGEAGAAAAGATQPSETEGLFGGRFQLEGHEGALGGGLTGQVYRARDAQSDQFCAVKLVDASVFPNPLQLQRAERELKQLERVALPEVARVLAHGRRGEQLWIAMELVAGWVPLDLLIRESGPLPPPRACALIRAISHGLAETAKHGVIHRDLAAKNVLVGPSDQVKLINFSVAVPFSDRVQGVAEFLSPEQVEGKPADQRSSIYSLGALLYLALTGRPPFVGEPAAVHQAHVNQEPAPPSRLAPVAPAVDGLVHKALEKHSARRFMTLHQLIGELDAALQNGAAAQPAAAPGSAHGKGAPGQGVPAATLIGVASLHSAPGSWAPPGAFEAARGYAASLPQSPAQPAVPAQQPAQPAAPHQHAAPAHAGPQAQPQPAQTPAGPGRGKQKAVEAAQARNKKGQFRETLWFKKGELDAAAAQAAAQAREGDVMPDRADALPIEDRYRDDGTVSRQDAERLSLRTGSTQMMQSMRAPAGARGKQVSDDELLGEMKGGRGPIIAVVLLALAVIGGLIAFFAS